MPDNHYAQDFFNFEAKNSMCHIKTLMSMHCSYFFLDKFLVKERPNNY